MAITLDPAAETDPVRRNTPPELLQKIEEDIERNVAFYAAQPDDVIAERIEQLKSEWTITRQTQLDVAGVGLAGCILALMGKRLWAIFPAAAFGFLIGNALTGWDPLAPYARRWGLRTRREIDRELYALKVARGDFKELPPRSRESDDRVKKILDAVNA